MNLITNTLLIYSLGWQKKKELISMTTCMIGMLGLLLLKVFLIFMISLIIKRRTRLIKMVDFYLKIMMVIIIKM